MADAFTFIFKVLWIADQLHPSVRVLHLGYSGRHCSVIVWYIVSFYFILRHSRLLELVRLLTETIWMLLAAASLRQRKHTNPTKINIIIMAIEHYNLLWPNDTLLKSVRGYSYPEASKVCNSQLTLLSEVIVINISFTKSDHLIQTLTVYHWLFMRLKPLLPLNIEITFPYLDLTQPHTETLGIMDLTYW